MKAIVLSENQWLSLRKEIDRLYPRSVSMIRWKMKEVLGFTDRRHTIWINEANKWDGMGYQKTEIHLDFFDDAKRTMFLLKFSDFLQKEYVE